MGEANELGQDLTDSIRTYIIIIGSFLLADGVKQLKKSISSFHRNPDTWKAAKIFRNNETPQFQVYIFAKPVGFNSTIRDRVLVSSYLREGEYTIEIYSVSFLRWNLLCPEIVLHPEMTFFKLNFVTHYLLDPSHRVLNHQSFPEDEYSIVICSVMCFVYES